MRSLHILPWLLVPTLACDAAVRQAVATSIEARPQAAAAMTADAPVEAALMITPSRDPAVSASGNGLTITAHTVINPPRAGSDEEDYWIQYEVYGEIRNDSDTTFEAVTGRITFHDARGAMLGIDSIGTAVKQDVGDTTPGETILGEVHFVEPGQSVPFHFMRNLAAIDGVIASHQLYARRGTPADDPPHAVAIDVTESFEGEGFFRKRMFAGTIRNDGDGGCRSPSFVVAFLDPAGKIASIESWDATNDLQRVLSRGESIAFRGGAYVTSEHAWREAAKVKTWVDCRPIY